MDNEASRAYIDMPEPRMAYITNRRLFENALNSSKERFEQVPSEDPLKLSSKIKRVYLHGKSCRKTN